MAACPTKSWGDIIRQECEWIQCTKCGDKPRGNPSMYCNGCHTSHGDWKPNMMGILLQSREHYHAAKVQLAKNLEVTKGLEAKLAALRRRNEELKRAEVEAVGARRAAASRKESAELAALKKGPETMVAAQRQSAALFDDLEGLITEQTRAATAADAVESRAAALESEADALTATNGVLEDEVSSLRAEATRLKDILVDAMARRGGAAVASAPAAPAAPHAVAADVWAHIHRAQAAVIPTAPVYAHAAHMHAIPASPQYLFAPPPTPMAPVSAPPGYVAAFVPAASAGGFASPSAPPTPGAPIHIHVAPQGVPAQGGGYLYPIQSPMAGPMH